jgi:hypothetical protein
VTKRAPVRRPSMSAAHRDSLRAFARAYLHEDVLIDYGSAAGAAAAFAADANAGERERLADALDRLSELAGDDALAALTRFFWRELRCSWEPASMAEVRAMAAAVRATRG